MLRKGFYYALLGAVGMIIVSLPVALGLFDPQVVPFKGDFEDRLISEEKWLTHGDEQCAIRAVREPVRSGQFSAEFHNEADGRCELLPWVGSTVLGRLKREPFQIDRWYGFSVFLPHDWRRSNKNEVIAQWHASKDVFFGEKGGRGPPLALRIEGLDWKISYGSDADLVSDGRTKAGDVAWRGPITPGKWTDWVMKIRWSFEEDGITRIWKDGELVVDRQGPNAYNDLRGIYLKLGSYHPEHARTVYIDEVRIDGPDANYESVMPPLMPSGG